MTWKQILFAASVVATLHFIGVCLTIFAVSHSDSGQAGMVFVLWAFIDLPWSLPLIDLLDWNVWVIHGLIGTVWWFVLTVLVIRAVLAVKGRLAKRT